MRGASAFRRAANMPPASSGCTDDILLPLLWLSSFKIVAQSFASQMPPVGAALAQIIVVSNRKLQMLVPP
jgi:hypothetical protein